MSNILLDMFRGHQDEPNEVLHKYVGSVLHVLHNVFQRGIGANFFLYCPIYHNQVRKKGILHKVTGPGEMTQPDWRINIVKELLDIRDSQLSCNLDQNEVNMMLRHLSTFR